MAEIRDGVLFGLQQIEALTQEVPEYRGEDDDARERDDLLTAIRERAGGLIAAWNQRPQGDALEPIPETLYTARCGWCGAYERQFAQGNGVV